MLFGSSFTSSASGSCRSGQIVDRLFDERKPGALAPAFGSLERLLRTHREAEGRDQEARVAQGYDEPVPPAKRLEQVPFFNESLSHQGHLRPPQVNSV